MFHRRRTPGSSIDQRAPSGAKARPSRSPSVWNGRAPKARRTTEADWPRTGGMAVELTAALAEPEGQNRNEPHVSSYPISLPHFLWSAPIRADTLQVEVFGEPEGVS